MSDEEGSLPIFDVQLVELQFDISAEFVAAQVADNVLILALSSGRILRFDLDNSGDIDGRFPRLNACVKITYNHQTLICRNDPQR